MKILKSWYPPRPRGQPALRAPAGVGGGVPGFQDFMLGLGLGRGEGGGFQDFMLSKSAILSIFPWLRGNTILCRLTPMAPSITVNHLAKSWNVYFNNERAEVCATHTLRGCFELFRAVSGCFG